MLDLQRIIFLILFCRQSIRKFQSSIDPSSDPSEIPSEIELWVQGNLNKKGRVYGLGSKGVKLKHLF